MATKKEIKFEEALTRLEDSVRRLESSELTLDESLSVFEEAVALLKVCNKKLETAEQRVRILTEGADGSVSDAPFAVSDNEA